MAVSKITDLIIAYKTEMSYPEGDSIHLIEGRVWELDQNLELTTEDIFDAVNKDKREHDIVYLYYFGQNLEPI